METNYFFWGALWLLVAAFFSAFIVFFGRKTFASTRAGFLYVALFFAVGVAMLVISVRSLR
jgi:hypothetical protein